MRMSQAEIIAAEFVGASDVSNMDGQTGFRFDIDPESGTTLVCEWQPRMCGDRLVDSEMISDAGLWIGDIAVMHGLTVDPDLLLDVSGAIGQLIRQHGLNIGPPVHG